MFVGDALVIYHYFKLRDTVTFIARLFRTQLEALLLTGLKQPETHTNTPAGIVFNLINLYTHINNRLTTCINRGYRFNLKHSREVQIYENHKITVVPHLTC